ncbi:hypothetical protein niasHT_015380 [Heterodera trifolii]|uniref:G protein alpha subunit n=1 Tax=Heterodera trifolii TaxID=157864 RepID=A0ABD2KZU2_9BILA
MGNSCGRNDKENEIDKILQAEFEEEKKIVKLLLLGAAEGGKSTLLRQMKIIHDNGYDETERCKKREAVYNNIVMGTVSIITGMKMLSISYENPAVENSAEKIMGMIIKDGAEEHFDFNDQTVKVIKDIWEDIAVQKKLLPRNNEFQFTQSYTYFMDSINRISNKEYVPTLQDILMLRITTTGIIEVKFEIKKVNFRVFDVGGQRSERKKWIHCFDNVHAILFVVAISEYDQKLYEDDRTNRMIESMRLFRSVCNSRWFYETAIILFLNKTDLFMEKIKKTSIGCLFKSYCGSDSYDDQIKYIEEKFKSLNTNPNKVIYIHETCATDTNQVKSNSKKIKQRKSCRE